jgi:phosphoesterase RecJ-like protein
LSKDTTIINIDHHITNDSFGRVNWVDSKSSSTSEILYELLLKAKYSLKRSTAINLYAGIMTDSGSFRYDNTSMRTLEIAACLMKFKFSISDLYAKLYESIPLADIKQFTNVVNRFKSYKKGRLLCLDLTKTVVNKFSEDFDLKDAVFKLLRSVKESRAFVIFSEVDKKKTRVNFRSTGEVDVAKIAHHFNGGGHKNASGCMLDSGLSETRKIVLREVGKYL